MGACPPSLEDSHHGGCAHGHARVEGIPRARDSCNADGARVTASSRKLIALEENYTKKERESLVFLL